jgi:hypothetical protein
MEIKRSGSQPSSPGPAEYFSGTVRIDPRLSRTQFSKPPPSQAAVALASFPRAQFRNRMIPSRSWSVTLLTGAPELTAGSCYPEMRWNPAPTLTVR